VGRKVMVDGLARDDSQIFINPLLDG